MKKTILYLTTAGIIAYLFMKPTNAFSKITALNSLRNCDPRGCGHFGAPRGSRTHAGLDIIAIPGETIFSPITGTVTRFPFAYGDDLSFTGIEIKNDVFDVKIFYLKPTVLANTKVKKGQVIGMAQNIAKKHGGGMKNHVHIEVRNKLGILIDPEILF